MSEFAVAIGKHGDCVANLLVVAPCAHDERVIDGETSDAVDAFAREFAGLLDESRKVNLRTAGRERSGHGE